MQITEELVRQIILDVLQQSPTEGQPPTRQDVQVPPLSFKELGTAKTGTDQK